MEKKPAEPRLSATILMLRDAASGPPEVLMVKRHYEIDFAAGALVFPGGKASADDSRTEWDAYTDGDYHHDRRDPVAEVDETVERQNKIVFADEFQEAHLTPVHSVTMRRQLVGDVSAHQRCSRTTR